MTEEEASKKRGFPSDAGEEDGLAGKRLKTPGSEEEEDDGDLFTWLTMDDETVTELSKLLDSDFVTSPPFEVKFARNPFSSPEIFQSSASYITINGNNDESCGSSFSESDSSVMASFDLGCWRFGVGLKEVVGEDATVDGGAWGNLEEARGCIEENGEGFGGGFEKMDGCDWSDLGFDFDDYDNDDVLARFVGGDFVDPHLGF